MLQNNWDLAPCAYLEWRDDGQISSCNRPLLELLGWDARELSTLDRLLTVPSRVFYQTHLFPLLKLHNVANELYLTLRSRSGEAVPVLTNARRHFPEGGDPINCAVFLHIPQRSRFEEELLQAKKSAEQATHAKEEFLALVSHELRTPLNSIMGWTQLLQSGALDEESREEALATIERSARSQSQLIEDILDFTRLGAGKMRLELEPVDVGRVAESARDVVRPTASARGIHLEFEVECGHATVMADAERLQQILWNLLSNAIKFTPRGGTVQLRIYQVNSSIEILVKDNGEGMEPDFLPYVFDRFRQAQDGTRRKGGLGLGMAITRELVELHGGTIRAHSQGRGHGAEFYVRLPLLNVVAPERHLLHDPTLPNLEDLRILVVDDQPDSRKLLRTLLEQRGADVQTAENGLQAYETLIRGRFDVIVSDIEMPGEDGYELMKRVRNASEEHIRRIPAVALTANARFADRMRALAAGFQVHVTKPVQPPEILAILANLTHRSRDPVPLEPPQATPGRAV